MQANSLTSLQCNAPECDLKLQVHLKDQKHHELVDQDKPLKSINIQLEKESTSINLASSQSHSEAKGGMEHEHGIGQYEVERTKKDSSSKTTEKSSISEDAPQQEHFSEQDGVEPSKKEASDEKSDSCKDISEATERHLHTRQDGVETTQLEDSTLSSKISSDTNEFAHQNNFVMQHELGEMGNSVEFSQNLGDSSLAAELHPPTGSDKIERSTQEISFAASHSPVDPKRDREQEYSRQDEFGMVKRNSTEVSVGPSFSQDEEQQKCSRNQHASEASKKAYSTKTIHTQPHADKAVETNNNHAMKDEIVARQLKTTAGSEYIVLAKQDNQKLQEEGQMFCETMISKINAIEKAEQTGSLLVEKILELLKEKLEQKLIAANALSVETEKSSAAGNNSKKDRKNLTNVDVREELQGLMKELSVLRFSLSHRKQTNFKLDKSIHTLEGGSQGEVNPIVSSEDLDLRLSEVIAELQNAKSAEALAVQNAGSNVDELEEVKIRLKKAADENSALSATAESLRIRWNICRTELESALDRERHASTTVTSIKDELKKTKGGTAAAVAAEALSKKTISELTTNLQEMSLEADKAKISHKDAIRETHIIKNAASQAKAACLAVECRLQAVYKKAEAAKASEAIAVAEIKHLSQPLTKDESGTETVSKEEYESLQQRLDKAQERTSDRLTEAMNLLKAEQDAEQELLKQLQEANAEVQTSEFAKQQAVKQAEAAEAGKVAVEGELRSQRAANKMRRALSTSIATPSPTYSGRLLTPEIPEKTDPRSKTDHFAQVYQLSLPPPQQKVAPLKKTHLPSKKLNLFAMFISFFSSKKRKKAQS